MTDFLGDKDFLLEWKKFISVVKDNPTARPITLESWKRCRELDLEPDRFKFEFLSDEELKQKVGENSQLIESSKPYMDSISLSLTGIPHMVALSDDEGWIIDFRGTPEELGGKDSGLCVGASWSEKSIGNNGIGTALALGEAVLIYGIEHYGMNYGDCACIGVPIKCGGKIAGALDISVPVQYAHPSRLHIAMACVNSIEAALSCMNKETSSITEDKKLSAASELIATAVHDLKNPLAVIRGLGQLGNLTADEPKVRNYFDRIIKQVDEMNGMVVELLSIFRPEELRPKEVGSVIERVVNSFTPICNSKNISLSFINNSNVPVSMCERLFKRTIENLVNNAVQIMDDGGLIEIRTETEGDSVLISIRDSAGGIPDEIKETLFEPFKFRRSGGTGLGLFMAYYTITNTHKGQIWFETEEGEGTTFFIKLSHAEEIDTSVLEKYRLASWILNYRFVCVYSKA